MKLEYVRLTHAQSVPNCFISNQVYHPVDDDHSLRGNFFILFQQTNTASGSFVASLINTLIREYYRQDKADRLECLEIALQRVNGQLKTYADGTSDPIILDGVFVLVCGSEIHITSIGHPSAFLKRDDDMLPLIEHRQNEDLPHRFSVITSGEIHSGDILVLATTIETPAATERAVALALTHQPLYESGRAYARTIKQRLERTAEAIFVRIEPESEATYQIFVDRSLETTAERLERVQRILAKHLSQVGGGAGFVAGRISKLGQSAWGRIKRPPPEQAAVDVPDSSAEVAPVRPPEEAEPLPPPVPTPTNDRHQPKAFAVHQYWHPSAAAPHEPKPTPQDRRATAPAAPISRPISRLKLPQSLPSFRAVYLLVGALIVIGLTARLVNRLMSRSETTTQSASERDSLIAQSLDAARTADAAQAKDDNPTAIVEILKAKDFLTRLNEKNRNEASRALDKRLDSTLNALVNSVPLVASAPPVGILSAPKAIVAAGKITYVLTANNLVVSIDNATATTVQGLPDNWTTVAAVVYDSGQRLAVYGRAANGTPTLNAITPDRAVKSLTRLDGQAWPETRALASYQTNLYLVGDAMEKAIPKGEAYRVVPYASAESTSNISSIVNNGTAFYAIENNSTLWRISANTPKSAIAITEVPKEFLPAKYSRIISGVEGTLYLFDREQQRVLEISPDGAYRGQFTFGDQQVTDCDKTADGFVCLTESNAVQTFSKH